MRMLNVFEIKQGKIKYKARIIAAVLDPNIRGLRLHLNGGWDWIDQKYGFIRLLLKRGQIAELVTHQDLLATDYYLQDMTLGLLYGHRISVIFSAGTGKGAFASAKRIAAAREKFKQFAKQNRESA